MQSVAQLIAPSYKTRICSIARAFMVESPSSDIKVLSSKSKFSSATFFSGNQVHVIQQSSSLASIFVTNAIQVLLLQQSLKPTTV
jgi:hypothetical protein